MHIVLHTLLGASRHTSSALRSPRDASWLPKQGTRMVSLSASGRGRLGLRKIRGHSVGIAEPYLSTAPPASPPADECTAQLPRQRRRATCPCPQHGDESRSDLCHVQAPPFARAAPASFSLPRTKGRREGEDHFGGNGEEAARPSGLSRKREINFAYVLVFLDLFGTTAKPAPSTGHITAGPST